MAMGFKYLSESCKRNNLTSLICEQGWEETMDDVLADNPDITADDLKTATMYRMLDENLDYGDLAEFDDEPYHQERMEARCDICEQVADKWVNGEFANKPTPELEQARNMSRRLADEWGTDL